MLKHIDQSAKLLYTSLTKHPVDELVTLLCEAEGTAAFVLHIVVKQFPEPASIIACCPGQPHSATGRTKLQRMACRHTMSTSCHCKWHGVSCVMPLQEKTALKSPKSILQLQADVQDCLAIRPAADKIDPTCFHCQSTPKTIHSTVQPALHHQDSLHVVHQTKTCICGIGVFVQYFFLTASMTNIESVGLLLDMTLQR